MSINSHVAAAHYGWSCYTVAAVRSCEPAEETVVITNGHRHCADAATVELLNCIRRIGLIFRTALNKLNLNLIVIVSDRAVARAVGKHLNKFRICRLVRIGSKRPWRCCLVCGLVENKSVAVVFTACLVASVTVLVTDIKCQCKRAAVKCLWAADINNSVCIIGICLELACNRESEIFRTRRRCSVERKRAVCLVERCRYSVAGAWSKCRRIEIIARFICCRLSEKVNSAWSVIRIKIYLVLINKVEINHRQRSIVDCGDPLISSCISVKPRNGDCFCSVGEYGNASLKLHLLTGSIWRREKCRKRSKRFAVIIRRSYWLVRQRTLADICISLVCIGSEVYIITGVVCYFILLAAINLNDFVVAVAKLFKAEVVFTGCAVRFKRFAGYQIVYCRIQFISDCGNGFTRIKASVKLNKFFISPFVIGAKRCKFRSAIKIAVKWRAVISNSEVWKIVLCSHYRFTKIALIILINFNRHNSGVSYFIGALRVKVCRLNFIYFFWTGSLHQFNIDRAVVLYAFCLIIARGIKGALISYYFFIIVVQSPCTAEIVFISLIFCLTDRFFLIRCISYIPCTFIGTFITCDK